jgi:hypothetical protein
LPGAGYITSVFDRRAEVGRQQRYEMSNASSYRTRRDAAAFLSERLGRRVTVGALHRHASDGTGPRYVMILGKASYRDEWLDEWVAGLAKAPALRRRKRAAVPDHRPATSPVTA